MSRKEIMKVYHGIPKSITDEHTIFYASLDGTPYSKDNEYMDLGTGIFTSMPTGYGYRFNGDSNVVIPTDKVNVKEGTIDLFVNFDDYVKSTAGNTFISFENTERYRIFLIRISDDGSSILVQLYKNSEYKQVLYDISITNNYRGIHHIRITWKQGEVIKLYIDGVIVGTTLSVYISTFDVPKYIVIGNGKYTSNTTYVYPHKGTLADIHISDIDRGYYFPNLPQDFIDGKAIIKPRFGQQQIKGDPLYSQRTLDRVSVGINVNEPQITCSRAIGDWTSGDTIKVKGLNGEIISGVIGSNTALFRSLEPEPFKPGSTGTIRVDNTNGVEVGDLVKRVNLNDYTTVRGPYTVSAVDTSNNTVTLSGLAEDGGTNLSYKYFFIEVTPSSSSPVVKTEDGIDVLGTWTDLGTNEPTFTLGDNTTIAGKDLYIEYSLIISSNNSDFPELPYGIEKAWTENGVEMKTINEIVITDDFKGKISGSMKECPHYSGYRAHSSLLLPSSGLFIEEPLVYENITNLDNATREIYNKTNTSIPQQVFIFDLVKMVERKFGCEIPSVDKVKWLKENIIKISVNHHGYGKGPNGNKIYMKVLNKGEWVGTVSHTSPTVTSKIFSWGGSGNIGNIDGGKVSFLVYPDATDGTTSSAIYTDYISIEITLKVDSTYTTLYCSNSRAREDKCNPVLIQKETKTIKRYLPSKECFVTECRYVDQKGISISTSKIYTVLFELPSVYITTQGTGSYNSIADDFAKNCLSFLGISSTYKYCNEDISDFDVSGYSYNTIRFNQVPTVFYYNGVKYIPSKLPDRVLNVATLYPCIVNYNGEIYLHLSIITYVNKVRDTIIYYLYPITNRPLLK